MFYKTPSVMVLDEPTSAFDAGSVEAFADLINEYKKSHIVILITHDEALIEKLPERVLIWTLFNFR